MGEWNSNITKYDIIQVSLFHFLFFLSTFTIHYFYYAYYCYNYFNFWDWIMVSFNRLRSLMLLSTFCSYQARDCARRGDSSGATSSSTWGCWTRIHGATSMADWSLAGTCREGQASAEPRTNPQPEFSNCVAQLCYAKSVITGGSSYPTNSVHACIITPQSSHHWYISCKPCVVW